jgi:hypothetical protein
LTDKGGVLGSGGGNSSRWHGPVEEWRFELRAVIFEDGEMVGPAAERLAERIQCERAAHEFVDAKLRIAEDEGRDLKMVLESLKPPRHSRQDLMAEAMHHELIHRGMAARMGRLRDSSKPLPPLPNFYRRKD